MNEMKTRLEFITKFGFAVLNRAAVDEIAKHGPILEVGAGSGYWTYELRKAGVDCIATDPGSGTYGWWDAEKNCGMQHWGEFWCDIERITGEEAVRKYPERTLLTVWPDLEGNRRKDLPKPREWPEETLAAYTGKTVLYVGEGSGGCTGTEKFHELLEEQFEEAGEVDIPQFWGIHDYLQIWQRKAT